MPHNHKYNFLAFTEGVSELCRCDSFQRFSPDTHNLEANSLYFLLFVSFACNTLYLNGALMSLWIFHHLMGVFEHPPSISAPAHRRTKRKNGVRKLAKNHFEIISFF